MTKGLQNSKTLQNLAAFTAKDPNDKTACLEKQDKGFANARQAEIEEYIYKLSANHVMV